MSPKRAFIVDLVQIAGYIAGYYAFGVYSLFRDVWGWPGIIVAGLVTLAGGNFLGATLAGHFRASIQRKLDQKQRKHER